VFIYYLIETVWKSVITE